jgi:hypothetical protein
MKKNPRPVASALRALRPTELAAPRGGLKADVISEPAGPDNIVHPPR